MKAQDQDIFDNAGRLFSPYLWNAISSPTRRAKTIEAVEDDLAHVLHTFDAIVFSGVSGALVAPVVAWNLGKHIIAVRKEGDSKHALERVEGLPRCTFRYLIIDDMICTGATLYRIVEAIDAGMRGFGPAGFKAECVGMYCYDNGCLKSANLVAEKIKSYRNAAEAAKVKADMASAEAAEKAILAGAVLVKDAEAEAEAESNAKSCIGVDAVERAAFKKVQAKLRAQGRKSPIN